jgi:hypothetical protein
MSTTPKARKTDPNTSHEAASKVSNVEQVRSAIYVILSANPNGLTDGQIERIYEKARPELRWPFASSSGLRTRRSELVEMGQVEHSGEYKLTESGRRTIVWKSKNPGVSR